MEKRPSRRAAALLVTAAAALLVPAAHAQDASHVGSTTDGSRHYFTSPERLTSDDTDTQPDIFERTATGLRRISTGPAGGNGAVPAIDFRHASGDGSRVTFTTAESLTNDDVDSQPDVYQRVGDTTERLSTGPLGGNSPTGSVSAVDASDDGTTVAFLTNETLAGGDASTLDVYLRRGDETILLSPAAGLATLVGMSGDGNRVFIQTTAKLDPTADQDNTFDVYQWTETATTLLSIGPDGGQAPTHAFFSGASRDGSRVFFNTQEKLITGGADPDLDNATDVYERSGGVTTQISTVVPSADAETNASHAGASADGSRVFFHTNEAMDPGDIDGTQDIYERSGATTTRLSIGTGLPDATFRRASDDGTRVFFTTAEPIEGGGGPDAFDDVFMVENGVTTLISTGPNGGTGAFPASLLGISADGARAFVYTQEKLTADDTDNNLDIYERSGTTTTRVTTGPSGGNAAQDHFLQPSGISRDGSRVVFTTREPLTPTDNDAGFDVYERSGTTTRLISGEGIPPQSQITAGPAEGATIAGKTPTFEFSADESASTFECRVDDAAFAPCTSPFTTSELGDGSRRFEVRATDAFGNLEPAAVGRSFTVDSSAPDTTITSGPSGATNQTAAQFGFEANEPGATFQCRLDGAAFAACTTPFTAVALSQGAHTFEVRATDAAGNVDDSPASRGITVDSAQPETTLTGGPGAGQTISDSTPTFSFIASEPSTFQCSIDSGPYEACNSPHTTAPLANGTHTFQVRARDAAGNLEDSPALRIFTVQASGPIAGTRLTITSRSLRLDRKRKIAVALSCIGPASRRCQGTLTIRTRNRVRTSRGRRIVTLARIRFNVQGGARKTVKLSPSATNRRLIALLRRVPVTVSATTPGQKAVSKRLTLRGS